MFAPLVAVLVCAGPFPLPSVDGKALAVTEGQKVFRLPMRFERVRAFYEEQFQAKQEPGVSVTLTGTAGSRTITLTSKRKGDTWQRAVVHEGEVETVVEVVQVLRGGDIDIKGNGKPLVEFVFGRSPDAKEAADKIDHTESIRAH